MKRWIIIFSLLLFSCGYPDLSLHCPPFEVIESRGIPEVHLDVLECAGYLDYALDNVDVVFFVDTFPGAPNALFWATLECRMVVVLNLPRDVYYEEDAVAVECWLILYGAYYIRNYSYDGVEKVRDDFLKKFEDNNCADLIPE